MSELTSSKNTSSLSISTSCTLCASFRTVKTGYFFKILDAWRPFSPL